jgi:hypothetical protein
MEDICYAELKGGFMHSMKLHIALLVLSLISFAGNAQQGENDLNKLYYQVISSLGEYIYGKEYFNYYYQSHKKPLLRIDEERSASLVLNGRSYSRIVLQYDTFTDEVILVDNNLIYNDKMYKIALNADLVNRFDLYFSNDTMNFRYFRKEHDPGFNIPDGFYEVAYDGDCRFLIKHMSSRYKYEAIDEYSYNPVRYLKIGDEYSRLSSKKQFVALFGDRSDEIRKFLRDNGIWFRKADKRQIADVLKFYENLNSGVN